MEAVRPAKIVKRYGVNGGRRFARVLFSDGTVHDVCTRTPEALGEETRAAVIKERAAQWLAENPTAWRAQA